VPRPIVRNSRPLGSAGGSRTRIEIHPLGLPYGCQP
jgi:hypothetical protein